MRDVPEFDYHDLLLGDLLGQGEFRKVYVYRPDPKYVIKVAIGDLGKHHNVLEFENWCLFRKNKVAKKWLCPIREMAEDASWLLMKRAEPLRDKEIPKKVPKFLCDVKQSNLGVYKNRTVCIDYGYLNVDIDVKLGSVKCTKKYRKT